MRKLFIFVLFTLSLIGCTTENSDEAQNQSSNQKTKLQELNLKLSTKQIIDNSPENRNILKQIIALEGEDAFLKVNQYISILKYNIKNEPLHTEKMYSKPYTDFSNPLSIPNLTEVPLYLPEHTEVLAGLAVDSRDRISIVRIDVSDIEIPTNKKLVILSQEEEQDYINEIPDQEYIQIDNSIYFRPDSYKDFIIGIQDKDFREGEYRLDRN